jgi:hypothetical protein
MRFGTYIAFACLIAAAESLLAQEQIAPPKLDPLPIPPPPTIPSAPPPTVSSAPPPLPAQSQGIVIPPPLSSTQTPGAFPPAPGAYPPPDIYFDPPPRFRRPLMMSDPQNPNAWVGIESLFWWSQRSPLSVPLLTTGPAAQGASAGVLGVNGTNSLDRPLDLNSEGGLRIYGGGWFDPMHTFGGDASIFFLGRQTAGYSVLDRSGTGNFVINEPLVGAGWTTQVSGPGLATGGSSVDLTSDFWGADVNVLFNVMRSNGLTVNLLAGLSFLQLDEQLAINAGSEALSTITFTDNLGNPLAIATPGSTITMSDRFTTRNQFYGGQFGAQVQYAFDRFFVGATGKLAIGSTQETVTVNGATRVYPVMGDPVVLTGGNYATMQIGRYSANRFAIAPQFQFNLGYQFTPFVRGMVGYNFLYLSQVARPGNQIDNTFDGLTRPFVPMVNSSYWTQGINISVQFSF